MTTSHSTPIRLAIALALLLPAAAADARAQEGDGEPKRLSSSDLRAARKDFESGIKKTDDPDAVAKAVAAYADTGDPKAIEQIVEDALYGGPAAMRAAEKALARVKGKRAVDAVADAWKDAKKDFQKMRLIRVLADIGVEAADKAIRGVGREKSFAVREQMMLAIAKLGHKDHLDLATKRLKDDHPRVRHAAARAVRALGGEVPEGAAAPELEMSFLPRALPTAGVMFVVDTSTTMQSATVGAKPGEEGPPKYRLLAPDVKKRAERFDKDVKWNVMTFSLGTRLFNGKEPNRGERRAADVADFFDGRARLERDRDTLKALEEAIGQEWVDTIVLVTDGLPAYARITDPQAVIDRVVPRCRDLGVVIHTVAMMSPPPEGGSKAEQLERQKARDAVLAFLDTLATRTGGVAKVSDVARPEPAAPDAGKEPGGKEPTAGGGGRKRPGGGGGGDPAGGGAEPAAKAFAIEMRNGRAASGEEARIKRAIREAKEKGDNAEIERILAAVGTCEDQGIAELAVDLGLLDPDRRIAEAALAALKQNPTPALHQTLAKRVKRERDALAVFLVLSALESAIGEEGAALIAEFIGHDSARVRSKAVRLLAVRPQPDIFALADALKKRLEDEPVKRIRYELARAIVAATGEPVEGYALARKGPGELIPETIPSDRVVFLIDASESMTKTEILDPDGKPGGSKRPAGSGSGRKRDEGGGEQKPSADLTTRWALAKRRVVEAVSRLGEQDRWSVIAFHGSARTVNGRGLSTGGGAKAANGLRGDLERLRHEAYRETVAGLEAAFADPEVDTVYLITDGVPNSASRENNSADAVLERLGALNHGRDVIVHVIAMTSSKEYLELDDIEQARVDERETAFKALCSQIAQKTGGTVTVQVGSTGPKK